MAAKFRKVDPRIWVDEKFRQLDAQGRLLALWLLTSSRVNRCGIVLWSPGLAAEETGVPPTVVPTVYTTVCTTLDWPRNSATNSVFLRGWWRYNKPDNVSALSSFLQDLHDVPAGAATDCLEQAYLDLPAHFHAALEGAPHRTPHRGTHGVPHQEKEKEKETEQEKETDTEKENENKAPLSPPTDETLSAPAQPARRSRKPKQAVSYCEAFERWWKLYLRHEGKMEALEAWLKAVSHVMTKESLGREQAELWLLDAVQDYRNSERSRWPKAKIPLGATWLNKRRYEDEREDWDEPYNANGSAAPKQKTFDQMKLDATYEGMKAYVEKHAHD